MNVALFFRSLATIGPIGYLPAPGTAGSLCAFLAAGFFGWSTFSATAQVGMVLLALCCAYVVITRALTTFNEQDPSAIVLDEVIGALCALYMVPYVWYGYVVAFAWFRLFDIYKPFGIAQIEKIPGAWGVLLDDMFAGILASLLTRIIFMLVL